nr:MAG TPA: hypothetical protein [Caudoviricetes sp.]
MDKIKCNIEVEVDRCLFYAMSAYSEIPLEMTTIDAIMEKGSYSISLSDIILPNKQKKCLLFAIAAILFGRQLGKEKGKEGK